MRTATARLANLLLLLALPANGAGRQAPILEGSVLDSLGRPVAGARIFVTQGAGSKPDLLKLDPVGAELAVADGSGGFSAPVLGGTNVVLAVLPGAPRRGVVAVTTAAITGGSIRLTIGGMERIRGRLRDRQGRPIAGATLRAIPLLERFGEVQRGWGAGVSREDGSFVVEGVDAGPYRIDAWSPGLHGALEPVRSGDARPVIIDLHEEISREERDRIRRRELSGIRPVEKTLRLTLDDGERPIPRVALLVYSKGHPKECVTDAVGQCSIAGLAPGRCEVAVSGVPAGGPKRPFPSLESIDLGEGEVQSHRIGWPRSMAHLRVDVLQEGDSVLPLQVSVYPGAHSLSDLLPKGKAAGAPHYLIGGAPRTEGTLPPGRYTALALWTFGPPRCASSTLDLSAGDHRTLKLRLQGEGCGAPTGAPWLSPTVTPARSEGSVQPPGGL